MKKPVKIVYIKAISPKLLHVPFFLCGKRNYDHCINTTNNKRVHFRFSEIDPCDNHECQNSATCIPVPDSFTEYVCSCQPGYEGDYCDAGVPDFIHLFISILFKQGGPVFEIQKHCVINECCFISEINYLCDVMLPSKFQSYQHLQLLLLLDMNVLAFVKKQSLKKHRQKEQTF